LKVIGGICTILGVRRGSEWAVTHAGGGAHSGQSRRQDAHDELDDGFPSFFFHSCEWFFLIFLFSYSLIFQVFS
jgi:hypothetical protein